MQYNDNLFKKLQQGWSDPEDAGIDWSTVDDNKRTDYFKEVVDSGIKLMLSDLLGDQDYTNRLSFNHSSIVLLNGDVFGQMMVIIDQSGSLNYPDQSIIEQFNALNYPDKFDDASAYAVEYYGKAHNGYSFVNISHTPKEYGLHLLSHELMHTIANATAVKTLRDGNPMGDEAVNEFFARLATQYLIASGVDAKLCGITTTEEMKSSTEANHDDWGAYGKRIKTSCDICNVVNSADKLTALKALARFYFLGEKRPLKID